MTADALFGVLAKSLALALGFVRRRKLLVLGAAALIAGGLYALAGSSAPDRSLVTAAEKPFSQSVSVSGKVRAMQDVSMSFESAGRVAKVAVAVGDVVEAGDVLVALASGTVEAELLAAKAQVLSRKNERANGAVNLAEVEKQEDTKVQSALAALLSTGLAARPFSDSYELEAPVVSGRYAGAEQGTYKVQIRRAGSTTAYELFAFNLESSEPVEISKTGPTALGTRGLFLSFPDEVSAYRDTTWYVEVPNKTGSRYAELYAAYEEALRSRDLAIERAQAELVQRAEGIAIADAALAAAEAEVARLTAELEKHTLRAPFAGTVTLMDVEAGDTIPANTPVVAVMSVGELEIESFVPEINVSYLEVGDPAAITLDAYGEHVPFAASVVAIDPAETIRDGVSTYRVRLAFSAPDERIRPGMTANIVITTDERGAVLSIPLGAVVRRNGDTFVLVREGDALTERRVTLGSVSSLGEVEIVSGLAPGDVVSVER